MLSFNWNGIEWLLADIGGGELVDEISGHAHSKSSYELHFITGGSGELITDSEVFALKENDFFVTGPDIYHAQRGNAENPMTDIFIYLQKQDSKKITDLGEAFLETHFCFCENVDNEIAKKILREYTDKKAGWQSAVSGLMMYLLTELMRLYIPDFVSTDFSGENLNDKRFVIIENEFIYNKNITLRGLSEKIGLCERQTQRLLRKYYGLGFREKKKYSKK